LFRRYKAAKIQFDVLGNIYQNKDLLKKLEDKWETELESRGNCCEA
jgi:hypothetical protein